jgi:hypothetical protein
VGRIWTGIGLSLVILGTSTDAFALGKAQGPDGRMVEGVCGTPVPEEPCPAKIGTSGPQPNRTIFVNRNGGNYNAGAVSDSKTNSAIVLPQSGSIAPLTTDDLNEANWQAFVQCMRDYYAPFNVTVVDVEPASGPYVEVVIGGLASDFGLTAPGSGQVLLGIASNDNFCAVDDNGVAFTWFEDHKFAFGGNPNLNANFRRQLCISAAHEAGHVLGLEHEVLKTDLMSYEDAATKAFVDADSLCGTYEANPLPSCSCGDGTKQNSGQKLLDLLGPYDTEPPTGMITSPSNGASVPPGFKVTVEGTDNKSLEKVELKVDGMYVNADVTPPFEIQAPADIALGAHTIEAVLWDKSSNTTPLTLSVTVEPACQGNGDCGDAEVCVEGACLGDVGHACNQTSDCATGLCAAGDGFEKFCTKTCTEGGDECPSGFECTVPVAGAAKCYPAEGGGGCRSVAGGRAAGGSGLAAFALLCVAALIGRARARRQ